MSGSQYSCWRGSTQNGEFLSLRSKLLDQNLMLLEIREALKLSLEISNLFHGYAQVLDDEKNVALGDLVDGFVQTGYN